MAVSPTTMSVSSYCLREQLGPITFRFPDEHGGEQTYTLDNPRAFAIGDFPALALETLGVRAIETVGFQFTGLDDPEIDRFEAALRDTGVQLLNVALDSGDLLDPNEVKRQQDIDELKRWISRFAAMGTTFVRVNPGSPMSPHQSVVPPEHLVSALRELGEYAQTRGSRLLVENHGGSSSDPVWLNALLDAVGIERCGLLLDVGNFDALVKPLMNHYFANPASSPDDISVLVEALDLSSLYLGIEELAPRAELVSVKAHVVSDDGTVGAVDLRRALGALAEHGYEGALSIEYEGVGGDPWAKTRVVLEAAQEAFAFAQAGL